jgi:hypothetical protein
MKVGQTPASNGRGFIFIASGLTPDSWSILSKNNTHIFHSLHQYREGHIKFENNVSAELYNHQNQFDYRTIFNI